MSVVEKKCVTISGLDNMDGVIFVVYNHSTRRITILNKDDNEHIKSILENHNKDSTSITNYDINFVYDDNIDNDDILYAISGAQNHADIISAIGANQDTRSKLQKTNFDGQSFKPNREARVLVIGGSDEKPYEPRNLYYEVGSHSTSNYGKCMNWNNIDFWTGLKAILRDHKFDVIMFDEGSTSWFMIQENISLEDKIERIRLIANQIVEIINVIDFLNF